MDLSSEIFSSDFTPSQWLTNYIRETGKSLQQCIPILQGLTAQLQALHDDEVYELKRISAKFLAAIPGVEQNLLLLKREIDTSTQSCPKVEFNMHELCELNNKKKTLERCSTALRELGKWNESLLEIETLIESKSQFLHTFKKITRLNQLLDSCLRKLPDYEKRKTRIKSLESTLHAAIKHKIRHIFLDDEVEMFEYLTVLMTIENNDIKKLASAAVEEEVLRVWHETRNLQDFFEKLVNNRKRYLQLLNLEEVPPELVKNARWMDADLRVSKREDDTGMKLCLSAFERGMHEGLKRSLEDASKSLQDDSIHHLSVGLEKLFQSYFGSPLHDFWRRVLHTSLPENFIHFLTSKVYKSECRVLFDTHVQRITELTRENILDYEKDGHYRLFPGILDIVEKSAISQFRSLYPNLIQYLDSDFSRYFEYWNAIVTYVYDEVNHTSNFESDLLDTCLTVYKATEALENSFTKTVKKTLDDFALTLNSNLDKLSSLELALVYDSELKSMSLSKSIDQSRMTAKRSLDLVVHCCVQPTYEMLGTYETDLLESQRFDEMVPLNSMTLVVEHIMTLIQQADSNETTTWLQPAVNEIYFILMKKLQKLRRISRIQGKRLVVDLSYLLKLGDALGGTVNNPLVKFFENLKESVGKEEDEIMINQLIESTQ